MAMSAPTNLMLRLDPIACDGHGYCAELLPEHVTLDEWGYPILDGRPVAREQLADARRAVTLCPRLALALERRGPSGSSRSG
jgi:ferredoxin